MKITTKTGDDGFTSLFGGKRVSKASCFIVAVGELDELNSFLGWVLAAVTADKELVELIRKIQDDLYRMMASVGAGLKCPKGISEICEKDVEFLENEILKRQGSVEKLKKFIKPGGGEVSGRLHIARSVCRRAERNLVKIKADYLFTGNLGRSLKYLNRLSDLLFILGVAKSVKK